MFNIALALVLSGDDDGQTAFFAKLLSKYNCAVRVEEEYHTEHGQAALRRSFNFDSPVT